MKEQATKRPWSIDHKDPAFIIKDGYTIGEIYSATHYLPNANCKIVPSKEGEANTRFILKAVNCHDELIEALKLARAVIRREKDNLTFDIIERILTKATS